MEKFGILGTTNEMTNRYLQITHGLVRYILGNNVIADIVTNLEDYNEILRNKGNSEKIIDIFSTRTEKLLKAGATKIVIPHNGHYRYVDEISAKTGAEFIKTADSIATAAQRRNIKKMLLLSTKQLMTENFFKDVLINKGIDIIIPSEADMDYINELIYDYLIPGTITKEKSKEALGKLVKLVSKEFENDTQGIGVAIACTELGKINDGKFSYRIPSFESVKYHTLDFAIKQLDTVTEEDLENCEIDREEFVKRKGSLLI